MERRDQIEALFKGLVEGKPYTKKIPLNRLSISGLLNRTSGSSVLI